MAESTEKNETPYKTLYKSVGMPEWRLILLEQKKRFAPEMLTDRIFYPALLFAYACELAKNFNAENAASEYAGLVVAFDVPPSALADYDELYATESAPEKLWLDFSQVRELNRVIMPPIRVVESFYGAARSEPKFTPQELNECGFL